MTPGGDPNASQRSDAGGRAGQSGPADEVRVPFLGSDTFDTALRTALAGRPRIVQVGIDGRVDVASFPERLDRWLVAVQDSGGRVAQRTVPPPGEPQGRFVATLVDFAVKLWNLGEQRRRYAAAAGYDAIVEVERDTGRVRGVVFQRRPDASPR